VLLVCVAGGATAAWAGDESPSAPARTAAPVISTSPIKAWIWRGRESHEVTLIGYTEDEVVVAGAVPNAPGGRILLSQITRARFDLEYDAYEVGKAVRLNDWSGAVRILYPVVKPGFSYVVIPENNVAELAMNVGTYMMRAATKTARAAGDDAGKQEQAQKQFEAAHEVFKSCARIQWSSAGPVAVLKGCRCLLAMNKTKTAQFHVNQLAEPMPGDAIFGHYWLIRGELEYRAGRFREGLDAALKSVCFENKDAETFPDALLLSARCYEELLEPYRARDVYYEVARLFPRTDWGAVAVDRLKIIMEKGLTRDSEKSPIENIFFKTSDDMNKLVKQLFADLEKPPQEEAEEPDETPSSLPDKPAARKEGGADAEEEPPPPAAKPPPAPNPPVNAAKPPAPAAAPATRPKGGTGPAR
jgi:tetratricopeptide (TPR) repeat protein